MARRLFVAAACVWTAGSMAQSAFAEPPIGVVPHGRFEARAWGRHDGLPQSSVTDLAQDRDGYLWVTTFGGVARFDGQRFVVFDLARDGDLVANRFLSVLEDRSGTLWLGTQEHGLLRRRGDRFAPQPLPPEAAAASVHDLALAGDGALYAASDAGIVRVVGDRAELVTRVSDPRAHARSVAVDRAGRVWASTPTGPLCNAGACPAVTSDPAAALGPGDVRGGLAADPEGGLWIATTTGLWRADAAGVTRVFARSEPTAIAPVVALDGPRRRVWFAQGEALFVRDDPAGRFEDATPVLAAALGADRGRVRSVFIDAEGLTWIGTDRAGLAQLRDAPAARFDTHHGRRADPASLVLLDRLGTVWVAHMCGDLDRRVGEGPFTPVVLPPAPASAAAGLGEAYALGAAPPSPFGLAPPPPGACAMALAADGAVWIASMTDVYRAPVRGDPVRVAPLPDAPLEVRALLHDADGTLWVGTRGRGLYALPPDGPTRRWSASDGLGDDSVFALVRGPDGALWIGTHAGAVRLDRGQLTRYGAADGLAPGTVRAILPEPDGTTWFGTYGGGLSRLRAGRLQRLTLEDGLCDNVVSLILDDGAGHLWMNGNRGVFHVRRADLDTYLGGAAQTPLPCALLDTPEGNGGAQPAGGRAPDGTLWLPTISGVIHLDPARLVAGPPPRVVIEDATLDGQPLALAPGALNAAPAGEGDLVVRYAGLAFATPDGLRFRYRLEGHDASWIEAGDRRAVSLVNLPPGEYRFEVEARSITGQRSAPARVAFSIAPALHERGWFRAGALALLLLAVWGVQALRTRAMRRRNRALRAEVTERQRAEERARQQERHYRTLFEGSAHGLFLIGPEGGLIEANRAASQLVGVPVASLAREGLAPHLAAADLERLAAARAQALAGEVPEAFEAELRRGHGEVATVRFEVARFELDGGAAVLVAAVDVTPLHRAEAQRRELELHLERSQRLESLGVLAGGLAHDFNNHLTAIGSAAAAMVEEDDSPAIRQGTRDIAAAVAAASALTNKLLVFGRPAPGGARDIDLGDLVADLAPILRSLLRADLLFRHVVCRPTGFVRVDPVRLEEAIVNLVVNARDAVPAGGSVTVATDVRSVEVAEAGAHRLPGGDYAVVTVADSGPGIPPEVQPRLFEPFFTTKPVGQGTGLGLAIVHATMKHARGFVTVASEPGAGARFHLHLPVVGTLERLARPLPPALDVEISRGARILVCDDHPLVRVTTARILNNRGYRALEAEDAATALALLEREAGAVDLLLTDVVLPGQHGPGLAREALARWPALRIVLMSGYAKDELDGIDPSWPFVRKPFATEAVLRAIERALKGGAITDPRALVATTRGPAG